MPSVSRINDIANSHSPCSPTPVIVASPNVFTNKKQTANVGSKLQPHCSPPHGRQVASGSSSVFVNNKNIARIGDSINCGGALIQGSPNVNAN